MLEQKVVKDTTEKIGGYIHGSRYVVCPVCNSEVSLTSSYYDEYQFNGAQVHYKCLSQKRLDEILVEKGIIN